MTNWTVKNELLINGTWVDVTNKTRGENKVSIQRGYQNEQGNSITPATCDFTLNNRDGLFSNRNPRSQYYGLLGRNVQFRSGIVDSTVTLWARAYGREPDYVETVDKAVLDITGDIDIRIDVKPSYFNGGGSSGYVLAAKYDNNTANRSWLFALQEDGTLAFYWSTAGASPVSAGTYVESTAAVSFGTTGNDRKALRVTLDVNNGAAGRTATFYTSDSITGTWTQLGSTVVQSGTTSIFNSSAGVQVGAAVNAVGTLPFSAGDSSGILPLLPFRGRIYGFRLYNGIGGTLVANADLTARSASTTSWSDGLGTPNTWQLWGYGGGEITNVDRRFHGEVPEFPQAWDTTGTDVYVECQATDIVRRLTQGAKPLKSSIYYNMLQYSPTGYWPMEDGTIATAAGSAATGAKPALVGDVTFGEDDTLPGSTGCVTLNSTSSYIRGTASTTANSTVCNFIAYVKLASLPGSNTTLFDISHTGTLPGWQIIVGPTTMSLQAYASDGTLTVSGGAAWSGLDATQWFAVNVELIQSGGNISYALNAHQVGSESFGTYASGTTAGTVRRFSGFNVNNASGGITDAKLAHMFINQRTASFVTSNFANSSNAYLGEAAGTRFLRLCDQEGVSGYHDGDPADTETMGYQTASTLMDLLQECADVDNGMLTTTRATRGIRMWSRKALQNQGCFELDYSANHLWGELRPTDDDQILRNDVTISRPNGSSARAVQESGPNNVNDPEDDPQGVGTYATSYSLNVAYDTQLSGQAEYARTIGTWDALRYPVVSVHLNRPVFTSSAALQYGVRALEQGRPFAIVNLPDWLPPDDAELLIRGENEVYDGFQWTFKWNTQPYGPFRINDLTRTTNSRYRVAASNSSLVSSLSSSATSFSVKTPTGKLWGTTLTKPGNFPLDIFIGGERMTVGAISGTSSPQTFSSVTRSVNGITKSHSADDEVQVAEPFRATL